LEIFGLRSPKGLPNLSDWVFADKTSTSPNCTVWVIIVQRIARLFHIAPMLEEPMVFHTAHGDRLKVFSNWWIFMALNWRYCQFMTAHLNASVLELFNLSEFSTLPNQRPAKKIVNVRVAS